MPIAYAYSKELISFSDKLPSNFGRASRIHSLIEGFGLIERFDHIIHAYPCSTSDLEKYHDKDFIHFLLTGEEDETEEEEDDENENEDLHLSKKEKYGLEYDCPMFEGLEVYIKLIAGATLHCAEYLINLDIGNNVVSPAPNVAINWTGGRHHAKRAACSGFCYINDIILGIQRLRTKFDKVIYIDLDLHHGDGVETAFAHSRKVKCISVHRYNRGFFPGTGGISQPRNDDDAATVNIPTKNGLSDKSFIRIFREIICLQKQQFQPNAVVITCGCDGLARDKLHEWNLTFEAFDTVITEIIRSWRLPTLLLGGGGYNSLDTARCLSIVTAAVLGIEERKEWIDIPMHEYFNEYVDDNYRLHVDTHLRAVADDNTPLYLDRLVDHFEGK